MQAAYGFRRGAHRLALGAMALAALALGLPAPPARAADAAHPTVVELFQSQGCSSCPPANANVMALAGRPDILALSWQVTYWDDLGWKDTFGRPEFTARQWDYAHALHRAQVATPQVVVNGRADVVGSRRGELDDAIRRADRGAGGPEIRLDARSASVRGEGHGASVYLVRYDPRVLQVPIQRGENGGRTLPHRNVVREVRRLGEWTGGERTFQLPPPGGPGLKTAILVQAGAAGPILAAAHD
jgi:hypothetical protein